MRGSEFTAPSEHRGARAIAGLLETFAQRGRRRVLARVDQSGGNLERDALRAVAVLADEHGLARRP